MTAPSRRMEFSRFDFATFTGFFSYASGSVVVPVALVTLARELGFSLESGGLSAGGALQMGRTVAMVSSMLLCGFAAGAWGKRRTFGVSAVLMGVGIGLCALAPSYGALLLALLAAGVGEGVIEALSTPFEQDLHPEEPGRYINFTHGFWSVGVLATVLASGALLSLGVSWRLVIGGVACLAFVPALLLLLPSRRAYPEHPDPQDGKTVWRNAVAVMRRPRFWTFYAAMFVAGGGEYSLTFWSASYIQLQLDSAAWAGGAGTACFAAGMVAARTGWGYLVKQRHLKRLILLSALGGVLVTLCLPLAGSLWSFFALLFLAGLATAPFWPSLQSYCADCLPGTDTTMLFILLACAGIPGCGFFTWLMGLIGNLSGGLGTAFFLVPACFLVLGVLVGLDWLYHRGKGTARPAMDGPHARHGARER